MFDLMNEMSELIYVVDRDTYELLFVNKAGKKMFGLDDLTGLKCYWALQGKEQPCDYCTNSILQEDVFYTWEFTNPKVQRHYLLKDKLIDWNGKKARIEIAFDMTASENEKVRLKNSLEAENLVTNCAKILYSDDHGETRFDEVLRAVGTFLESQRAYIFEISEDKMDNTYEWCAFGVEAQIRNLQDMPVSLIDRWLPFFDQQQCVLIENLEDLRTQSPEEYQVLAQQEVHSLIVAPMSLNRQLVGYIGVDNYATGKLSNAAAILGSIGYFVGSVLRHRKTLMLLERLSYYDTLTGAMNRNGFMRDMDTLCDECEGSVGVVYIDVNGMKQLNDQYGHQQGDAALVGVAQKVQSAFPKEQVYRIGGDEFVVICKDIEEERFHANVRDMKNLFAAEQRYSVSVGMCWSEQCRNIQNVIYEADERMYHDKKAFYHGKALSGRYRHSVDDVLDMTKPGALQAMVDTGKFLIYFQPKISINTQLMIGSEALVRCELTPGKILPPSLFIPVLEESRLISVLDFYVFESVCAQIRIWLNTGRVVTPVSINFSRYTLCETHFVEKLQEIWKKTQVPKELIEIEVTETVEADDSYDFLSVIRQVKGNDFSVSIDDFGVKNANLSLFTSMDFDVLKIDKSLIHDLDQNVKAQAVLSSISDICRKMQIKLIVEGVETQKQFEILQRMDCDGVQGFLFSKPIPLEVFEKQYLSFMV